MIMNDNVLYASYQVGAKKVISIMSVAALPKDATNPLTEPMVKLDS